MKSEKDPIEMLRTARTAVREEVEKSIHRALQQSHLTMADHEARVIAEVWTDRFMALRALKQRGDHAAFVDPTDARDCLRWLAALCVRQRTHGLVEQQDRTRLYREYIDTLFERSSSSDTVSSLFPRDAMNSILAILNHPSMTEVWRSRRIDVRGFIELCAEDAGLKDMRSLWDRKREKLRKPISVDWHAFCELFYAA